MILVAIIQNSGISEGDGPKDAKARKVVDFVKKYGTAKLESSTISDYTKQLDDSMKEFQVCVVFSLPQAFISFCRWQSVYVRPSTWAIYIRRRAVLKQDYSTWTQVRD